MEREALVICMSRFCKTLFLRSAKKSAVTLYVGEPPSVVTRSSSSSITQDSEKYKTLPHPRLTKSQPLRVGPTPLHFSKLPRDSGACENHALPRGPMSEPPGGWLDMQIRHPHPASQVGLCQSPDWHLVTITVMGSKLQQRQTVTIIRFSYAHQYKQTSPGLMMPVPCQISFHIH